MLQNKSILTEENIVACKGKNKALGHPKVYLAFGKALSLKCPYCLQEFIKQKSPKEN